MSPISWANIRILQPAIQIRNCNRTRVKNLVDTKGFIYFFTRNSICLYNILHLGPQIVCLWSV